MRNRSVILLVALGCGMLAAVGITQWMSLHAGSQQGGQTVEIFVANRTIDVGEKISAENIQLLAWQVDRVPEGATSSLEDLEGKFVNQKLFPMEAVISGKLVDTESGTSQNIPVGFSVVTMAADANSSVAGLVRPGDRVDVTAYFVKSELIPETTAKTILTAARVFAVNGKTSRETDDDDSLAMSRSISLLIHKEDTPAWTYATELGKVRLTLGNPADAALQDDSVGNPAAQEFLNWLSEYQIAQSQLVAEVDDSDNDDQRSVLPQTVPVPQPPKGFKMIKMSGGVLTEYWIEDGKTVPVEVGKAGSNDDLGAGSASPLRSGEIVSGVNAPTDYSYLNGSQSPFYQPETTGGRGQLPPTPPGSTSVPQE